MNNNTNDTTVQKLLDSVRAQLTRAGVTGPSDTLTLLTAKELGLVQGKRGRGGGTFPTDAGLNSLGLDVATFRSQVSSEKGLTKAQTTGAETNEQ